MKVYIRDDDLGYTYDSLEEYLQVFVDLKVPVNLQAIPARCYQNAPLKNIMKKFLPSGFFEIHQHGLTHLPLSEWGEMGATLETNQIGIGRGILEEIFGEHFKPYFTAPWEKIHPIHLKYIEENYKGISPDNLPIQINLRIGDEKGNRWKTLEELKSEFINLKDREYLGIVLHHYLYGKNHEALQTLRDFITYLKEQRCQIVKFSELNIKEIKA